LVHNSRDRYHKFAKYAFSSSYDPKNDDYPTKITGYLRKIFKFFFEIAKLEKMVLVFPNNPDWLEKFLEHYEKVKGVSPAPTEKEKEESGVKEEGFSFDSHINSNLYYDQTYKKRARPIKRSMYLSDIADSSSSDDDSEPEITETRAPSDSYYMETYDNPYTIDSNEEDSNEEESEGESDMEIGHGLSFPTTSFTREFEPREEEIEINEEKPRATNTTIASSTTNSTKQYEEDQDFLGFVDYL